MLRKNSLGKSTRISDLSDTNFSTLPANNDILSYNSTTLKWQPKASPTISQLTGVSTYIIEISKWGITQGLPTKKIEVIGGVNVNCYSDADYAKAHNNIIGINNALAWAYANGYRYVIMPLGSYALCNSNISDNCRDNRITIDYDNFTFDLNASTFKILFDSVKRSPYDKARDNAGVYTTTTTEPPYSFGNVGWGGVSGAFVIRDCSYATLKNGKLIGDKIDRDFIVRLERNMQNVQGVQAGGNGRHITVDSMDISLCMGDGTTCGGGSSVQVKNGYEMGWQVADLDGNGLVITSTTHCASDYIAVEAVTHYFILGLGDTQGFTYLRNKKHAIYCYDTNKVFLGRLPDSYVLRGFKTMKNTAFIRFVVEEYKVDPYVVGGGVGGWYAFLYKGLHGDFTTFSNNYIHHCNRGGHSQCLNDTLIVNSHFYNNGEATDKENGLPGFESAEGNPDHTRYHINVEDMGGYNMHIIGNRFDNGHLGVAVRGHSCVIKDNWFKDCLGVILYRMHHAVVRDNYFDNAAFDTFGIDTAWNDLKDYVRYWYIDGNTFDGTFQILGTAVVHSISNNIFKSRLVIEPKVNIFSKNTFYFEKDFLNADHFQLSTIDTFEHCVFTKSDISVARNSFSISNTTMVNCTFKNMKVGIQNVELKNCIITDSGFQVHGSFKVRDSKFTYGTYLLKNYYDDVGDNSSMICTSDTYSPLPSDIEFINCNITSAHSHALFSTYFNRPINMNLKLENTKITRTSYNGMGFDKFNGILNFNNVTIISAIAAGNFVPNASLNHRFTDCTFTGLSFTTKTGDIQYAQSDITFLAKPLSGSSAPVSIPQKIGQEYYDTTGKKLYKAFGTTASTDWIIMN